jgi:hypothetical protein
MRNELASSVARIEEAIDQQAYARRNAGHTGPARFYSRLAVAVSWSR